MAKTFLGQNYTEADIYKKQPQYLQYLNTAKQKAAEVQQYIKEGREGNWEEQLRRANATIATYSPGGKEYESTARDYEIGIAEKIAPSLGITGAQLIANPQLFTDKEALAKYTGGTYNGTSYAPGTPAWAKEQAPQAPIPGIANQPPPLVPLAQGGATPKQPVTTSTTTIPQSNPVNQAISNLFSITAPGQTSEQVRKLQQSLIKAGFSIPAGATGYYGPQTQAALDQWKTGLQNGWQNSPNNIGSQNTTSTSSESVAEYDTGNEQLNAMLKELKNGLQSIIDSGKTINPDIELTPAQIQQFTDLASSQISPYYRSQIDSIKSDLTKSIENLQKQYDVTKQGTEAEFKSSLGNQREIMAGAGTTFSGQRGQAENQMVSAQNRALDLSALQTENQIGSKLREIEGNVGSTNLPQLPQFKTYQATTEGQGSFTPGRTLSFSSTGGIMGSLPQQQKEAELLRLSKYKQAAREGRALDFYL